MNSTIDRLKHTEQYIQTDITYPLESNDLRQGCFLIEDDDDQNSSQSPQSMFCIKKEEVNFSIKNI